MTLMIELEPETEAQLREKAAREGQAPEAMAARILAQALEWEARDHADAIEDIRRGLEDSAAGRVTPLKEWDAKMRAKYGIPADAVPPPSFTG